MDQHHDFLIVTDGLTKKYNTVPALDNLNLQVSRGEVFGFLGHNGAGKTTTVNILTSLLVPTSGRASICGFDVQAESKQARGKIGYLPENVKFYEDLTAYENLEFFARLSGVKHPAEKISKVLAFLDFPGIENKKLGEFSKGMRQRIGIAQAIIHEPEVLFLDEPTSGLDPMGIKHLREVILRLNREKGMTIFMNTHLLSEVARTCTTIGVLNHGRLVYKDSLENTLKTFTDDVSLETIYLDTLSE
ncbi:MAG: ABC transporter ATP-binding protein [Deltaproteobacteria bacterium]|nr:ABC transporter ATP-binding protein [Deltaproteobacteria bacterium]